MRKRKRIAIFIDMIALILLVAIDQITKYYAVTELKGKPAVPIIEDVLEFNYLENRGAAFGLLQNQKFFFLFVGIVILGVILFVLFKIPGKKRYDGLHILLVMIAGGAIGNMIDRIRLDYVVDFISFVLINFPIFNVADMYVTISMAGLFVLILFVYKEDDFSFLSFKQKKYREIK